MVRSRYHRGQPSPAINPNILILIILICQIEEKKDFLSLGMRGNNHRRGQGVPNHQPRYLVLAYLDLLLTKWKVLGRHHAIKSFRRIAKNKPIPSSLFVC